MQIVWAVLLVVSVVVIFMIATTFRKVVSTNMVHIVQSRKRTAPYGTGQGNGNVYYKWPSWLPYFGVTVIELPVSNFDLSLKGYEAYDKDRVPFMVDVTAFFRIKDTALAAQRVSSVEDLENQLLLIVQGAVRKVLASDVIDTIMLERSKFGSNFTNEVKDQLAEWGVESVKSMELMDIRDAHENSKVISNIMAKKTSHIEMESRTEVANNMRKAKTAEIEADQAVEIRRQDSAEAVGKRTAEKDQAVGISQQQSRQEVLTQEKITKERDMEVSRVAKVKSAEITRDEKIVEAEQGRRTTVIEAEGALEAKTKQAQGVELYGKAEAAAEQAKQLAPVQAQIALAKEIGTNDGYQKYLAMIKAVEAYMTVGSKQAEALQHADVKVISNTGSPTSGLNNVMELFSSKGGTEVGAAIQAFAQTPIGESILAAIGAKTGPSATPKSRPENGQPRS